jgi:hypothetical protein
LSGTTSQTVASATISSHCEQIDGGDRGIAGLAQLARKRCDQNEEDDAGGAEMPLPRQIVLAVRIDQRVAWRQLMRHLVVIDDDDVDVAPSAAASASWLVEPQSTVTISRRHCRSAD